MKKIFLLSGLFILAVGGYLAYKEGSKIFPFYKQLTQDRMGNSVDLQNSAQKGAHFVGSKSCQKCHENHFLPI